MASKLTTKWVHSFWIIMQFCSPHFHPKKSFLQACSFPKLSYGQFSFINMSSLRSVYTTRQCTWPEARCSHINIFSTASVHLHCLLVWTDIKISYYSSCNITFLMQADLQYFAIYFPLQSYICVPSLWKLKKVTSACALSVKMKRKRWRL